MAAREILTSAFAALTCHRQSIEEVVQLCVKHSTEADTVISVWLSTYRTSPTLRLTLLYVLHELYRKLKALFPNRPIQQSPYVTEPQTVWQEIVSLLEGTKDLYRVRDCLVEWVEVLGLWSRDALQVAHVWPIQNRLLEVQFEEDMAVIQSEEITRKIYSTINPRGQSYRVIYEAAESKLQHELKAPESVGLRREAESYLRRWRDAELQRLIDINGLLLALSREIAAQVETLESRTL